MRTLMRTPWSTSAAPPAGPSARSGTAVRTGAGDRAASAHPRRERHRTATMRLGAPPTSIPAAGSPSEVPQASARRSPARFEVPQASNRAAAAHVEDPQASIPAAGVPPFTDGDRRLGADPLRPLPA